jgi:catechol 2,3-dioxygenase-like lactoylglutathione lyase family enzyme
MSEVLALDHVQLAMPPGGEDAARAFYDGLLGLPEVPKPAPLAVRGGCWFAHGGVRVHLGAEPGFRPAEKAHPAFTVADLDGLAVTSPQRDTGWTGTTSSPTSVGATRTIRSRTGSS